MTATTAVASTPGLRARHQYHAHARPRSCDSGERSLRLGASPNQGSGEYGPRRNRKIDKVLASRVAASFTGRNVDEPQIQVLNARPATIDTRAAARNRGRMRPRSGSKARNGRRT